MSIKHEKRSVAAKSALRVAFWLLFIALPLELNVHGQAPDFAWARQSGGQGRFSAGMGVAADKVGNIYVTGSFDSPTISFETVILTNRNPKCRAAGRDFFNDESSDMFLVKYDRNGAVAWVTQGGGSDNDMGFSCALDSSSNVYVLGASASTNAVFGGRHFTNANGLGIYLAKYTSAGRFLWLRSSARYYTNAFTTAVAVDAQGNACICGSFAETNLIFGSQVLRASQTSDFKWDTFLVKYNTNGDLLWARQLKHTSQFCSVCLDALGNSYLAGTFHGSANFGKVNISSRTATDQDHAYIAKYDTAGNALWAFEAIESAESRSTGIALDKGGNIFVSGVFTGPSEYFGMGQPSPGGIGQNIFLAKYDVRGSLLWAKTAQADHTSNSFCNATAVAVDDKGCSYLTGEFDSANFAFDGIRLQQIERQPHAFVVKYDPTGDPIWAKSAEGGFSNPHGIAVIPSGGVVLTGQYMGPDVKFDDFTLTNTFPEVNVFDIFVAKIKAN
jgi:hypothetical protein